ncbi:MAG: hypothetical protein QME68_03375, partial [Elusimicrobiota bacterium]|nr:hypothetical protein [Elusimicrobiota bacterium]
MKYLPEIILNVFIPVAAGLVFFALARFVQYVGPLRQFVAGEETYRRAFIGFIAFGFYLATRPLQVLLGPHPMPLIINNIREFFMIGIFGPSIFVAIYGLAYGAENVTQGMKFFIYTLCITFATVFVIVNI